jgi:hypothetical protein
VLDAFSDLCRRNGAESEPCATRLQRWNDFTNIAHERQKRALDVTFQSRVEGELSVVGHIIRLVQDDKFDPRAGAVPNSFDLISLLRLGCRSH